MISVGPLQTIVNSVHVTAIITPKYGNCMGHQLTSPKFDCDLVTAKYNITQSSVYVSDPLPNWFQVCV